MTKELWINLPVKDVLRSRAFFSALGFSFNPSHGAKDESAQGLMIGTTVVMLFPEKTFQQFTNHPITNTETSVEFLLSIDAESREEVDIIAQKVKEIGGAVYGEPSEQLGWLYGCGFTDLDGHRWNVLYMDYSKMPSF